MRYRTCTLILQWHNILAHSYVSFHDVQSGVGNDVDGEEDGEDNAGP